MATNNDQVETTSSKLPPITLAAYTLWNTPSTFVALDYSSIASLANLADSSQFILKMVRTGEVIDNSIYNDVTIRTNTLAGAPQIKWDDASETMIFPINPATGAQYTAGEVPTADDWANLSFEAYLPDGTATSTNFVIDTTKDYPVILRRTFNNIPAIDWQPTSRVTGGQLNLNQAQILNLANELLNDTELIRLNRWMYGIANGVPGPLDLNRLIPADQIPQVGGNGSFLGVIDSVLGGTARFYNGDPSSAHTDLAAATAYSDSDWFKVGGALGTLTLTPAIDGISTLNNGDVLRVFNGPPLSWTKIPSSAFPLGAGSITTTEIADGTVTTADLADDSVTGGALGAGVKLQQNTVTQDNLSLTSVGNPELIASSVDFTKMLKPSFDSSSGSAATPTILQTQGGTLSNQAIRLDQLAAPNTDIALGGNKLTGLGTPTANGDAATKLYVDQNAGTPAMELLKTYTFPQSLVYIAANGDLLTGAAGGALYDFEAAAISSIFYSKVIIVFTNISLKSGASSLAGNGIDFIVKSSAGSPVRFTMGTAAPTTNPGTVYTLNGQLEIFMNNQDTSASPIYSFAFIDISNMMVWKALSSPTSEIGVGDLSSNSMFIKGTGTSQYIAASPESAVTRQKFIISGDARQIQSFTFQLSNGGGFEDTIDQTTVGPGYITYYGVRR